MQTTVTTQFDAAGESNARDACSPQILSGFSVSRKLCIICYISDDRFRTCVGEMRPLALLCLHLRLTVLLCAGILHDIQFAPRKSFEQESTHTRNSYSEPEW